ncbi:DUF2391 family protein [Leptolyngbya sp. 7M]|uniref:DUF2391 family protein n=1 Tax=Leptolyngbya sp. 7M TaxID=2812896 RepID=UPI003977C4D3
MNIGWSRRDAGNSHCYTVAKKDFGKTLAHQRFDAPFGNGLRCRTSWLQQTLILGLPATIGGAAGRLAI